MRKRTKATEDTTGSGRWSDQALALKDARNFVRELYPLCTQQVEDGDRVVAFQQKTYSGTLRMFETLLTHVYTVFALARAEREILEKRVAELEAKPTTKYRGVWKTDTLYADGEMVTDHGSVWASKANNNASRPGGGNSTWQLAVKRGRDAR